jgi:hypothetical protein
MPSKTFSQASLIILLFFLFNISPFNMVVEAKTDPKNSKAGTTMPQKKWGVFEGFRSAKFGMDEKKVSRAIGKDFKISSSKIKRSLNSLEKTVSLEINVPELLGAGGASKVGYIFGHQTKKLMQVNILWGFGVNPKKKDLNAQSLVDAANLLRDHFLKKRYKADSMIVNGKMGENTIIVFRGADKKGRMALLTLNTPKPIKGETPNDAAKRTRLSLSYILNPDKPDVLTIKDGDF